MKKKYNYYTRLFRLCRQEWSRSNPERKLCLTAAKIKMDGLDRYKCAMCIGWFSGSDIDVDHITPVANTKPENFDDFVYYLGRLHTNNLQILCKPCHKLKTKHEIQERAKKSNAEIISTYAPFLPAHILKYIEDGKTLKKMASFVKKMQKTEGDKHAVAKAKLDVMCKKYL